jgi:2'-5' RNA ligase
LQDLVDRLQSQRTRIKWVAPEHMHLTLRFLGEVDDAVVARVKTAVHEAGAVTAPFDVLLEGVGGFPDAARAEVVWVGVTRGAGELARLHQRLSDRLAPAGFPPEGRPFKAHLTLGRRKDHTPDPEFRRRLEAAAHDVIGQCPLHSVSLMRSVLGAKGPTYSTLLDAPLVAEA